MTQTELFESSLASINPSGNIEIDLSIQHLLGENGTLPVSLQNKTVQCFEKTPVPYQSQQFEGVRGILKLASMRFVKRTLNTTLDM